MPAPASVPYLATGVPYPDKSPADWASCFDKVEQMFGFGDWTEESGEPYYKWRMTQIGIWKRVCTSRKVEPWDLYLAGLYAKEHDELAKGFSWLCGMVPKARRWWLAEARERVNLAAEAEWERAVRYEQEHDPDGDWLVRLYRAGNKAEVTAMWRDREGPTTGAG